MTQTYVRVPPQSTGKRVLTTERYLLRYDNLSGTFTVGRTINGATSGASGVITSVDTEGFSATEGILWLTDVSGTFINDENLQISGVTQAISNIVGTYPFESYAIQNVNITDPENPSHKQRIDRFGSQLTTFADGAPSFGAFNTLQIGQAQIIKEYRFAYDSDASQFWDFDSAGGSVSYRSQEGLMMLQTPTTSGAKAMRTSNFYHPYAPGIGHLIEMTIRSGDAGKNNVRRRWGYYDDYDGVFFELDGTDLYVVQRSSVSGSVIETRIHQSNWNRDPLDGSDNIGFTLDVSAPNIYFMDLQWLGAGRVRFGIIEPSGSRLVAHVMENANNNASDFPYMRSATLPLRVEQENVGPAASTSEIRLVCCVVKHTARSIIAGDKFTSTSSLKTIVDSDGPVPIFSIRPAATFKGLINRCITKGISTTFVNKSNSPVIFRVHGGTEAILTGDSWATPNPLSSTEVDASATVLAGGLEVLSIAVGANSSEFIQDLADRTLHTFELVLGADGVVKPILTISAELIGDSALDTGKVLVGVNWEEIRG